MNPSKFKSFFKMMCVASRVQVNEDTEKAYYMFLGNMDEQTLKTSIVLAVKNNKTDYPSLPSINAITNASYHEVSEIEIREDIMKAISDYGIYSSPKLKHSVSRLIVADIGWVIFCRLTQDEADKRIHYAYAGATKLDRENKINGKALPYKEIRGLFSKNDKHLGYHEIKKLAEKNLEGE